jgi:transposase
MRGGTRVFFDDKRWAKVSPLVRSVLGPGPKGDARRFLEAVVWILRSGAPWRDLADRLGPWQRVYRRYRRWALSGRWERLRRTIGVVERPRLHLIDSTIVKAHAHAAGALRRLGRQALGRSRGGFTTKLHAVVTERGELVRYVLTGGEVADITQARLLVRNRRVSLVGDRAYDCDAFVAHIERLGGEAVIPSKSNRRHPRALDKPAYRERNVIERWFGRMKVFRRVATRYEKTAQSYLGVVAAAAWLVALTGWQG